MKEEPAAARESNCDLRRKESAARENTFSGQITNHCPPLPRSKY